MCSFIRVLIGNFLFYVSCKNFSLNGMKEKEVNSRLFLSGHVHGLTDKGRTSLLFINIWLVFPIGRGNLAMLVLR